MRSEIRCEDGRKIVHVFVMFVMFLLNYLHLVNDLIPSKNKSENTYNPGSKKTLLR
jgi:hypothetical protein